MTALGERRSALNQVDLVFVVDTTGSMGPFINTARQHMVDTLNSLTADSQLPIDLQFGLVEYRDHPPQDSTFAFRAHPFTGDLRKAQKTIDGLQPAGGGDAPESVYDGLWAAVEKLAWRPHSRRLAVLVGDAPPQGYNRPEQGYACTCGLTPDQVTALFETHNVTLYALGLTNSVSLMFTRLANYTGGVYFAAGQGLATIEALKSVLTTEFGDLEFDRQVLAFCQSNAAWSGDGLSEGLNSGRGRVSASLSRLGRRGLLG